VREFVTQTGEKLVVSRERLLPLKPEVTSFEAFTCATAREASKLTPVLRGFYCPSSRLDPAPLAFLESGGAWKQPGSKLRPRVFTLEYRLGQMNLDPLSLDRQSAIHIIDHFASLHSKQLHSLILAVRLASDRRSVTLIVQGVIF
jgi:hypothetical protein